MNEKEYTIKEASEELGITVPTVYHHINRLRIDLKYYGKRKHCKGQIGILNEKQMNILRSRNERPETNPENETPLS